MKKWSDAKTFLFVHLVMSCLLLVIAATWDVWLNLAHEIRLIELAHEPFGHPYDYGVGQKIMSAVAVVYGACTWWFGWRYYE